MGPVMHRRFLSVTCAFLLLAGCADETPPVEDRDEVVQQDRSGEAADGDKEGRQGRAGESRRPNERKVDDGARGGGRGGNRNVADTTEGSEEDDSSSAFYPAAGTYSYDQQGTEEFCDTTSCEEEPLPKSQVVETTHERRSEREVVVVTDARSSQSRRMKTRTTHSPDGALITNVQVHFRYEGFSFTNSYQPSPPVEAVHLPLRAGQQWQGSWKDSTSGDYEVRVGEPVSLSVAGGTVQAFPLHTVTHFRGEFEGRADVTIWIDPATSAIVKTQGEMKVKSVFGSYSSNFTAILRSAPGYR